MDYAIFEARSKSVRVTCWITTIIGHWSASGTGLGGSRIQTSLRAGGALMISLSHVAVNETILPRPQSEQERLAFENAIVPYK